jgi:hypothetical protein
MFLIGKCIKALLRFPQRTFPLQREVDASFRAMALDRLPRAESETIGRQQNRLNVCPIFSGLSCPPFDTCYLYSCQMEDTRDSPRKLILQTECNQKSAMHGAYL